MKFILFICTIILFSSAFSQNFNLTQYEKYWNLTRISYCDEDHIKKWECGPLCEQLKMQDVRVVFNLKMDLQTYIGYKEETIDNEIQKNLYFVIKGTDWPSHYNLWLDAEAIQVEYENQDYKCKKGFFEQCFVHKGFQDAYKGIKDESYKLLEEFSKKHQTNRVIMIGHSLGAGMAVIGAVDLIETQEQKKENENKLDLIKFVTFGGPRAGNKRFIEYFDEVLGDRKMRVTNHRDFIVHLPPEALFYRHIKDEIYLYPENTDNLVHWKYCSKMEDKHCSDGQEPQLSWHDHTTYFNLSKDDIQNVCKLNKTNSIPKSFIEQKLYKL